MANDLYGVVPKGSQPTFKLVAGQVQVDTPLTLLNSTVQAPKVAYQEVKPKQTTAEAAEESNEHSGDTTVAEPNHFIPKSIATSVLVLFGLIFSVITRQLQKRLERQKNTAKKAVKLQPCGQSFKCRSSFFPMRRWLVSFILIKNTTKREMLGGIFISPY